MDFIKKFFMILLILFCLPTILIADELDDALPRDTPVQIKERARQVIRLGVENQGIVKMTKTMLRNMFTEQQMLQAFNIIIEAKTGNLPEDPIINKLYEGVGKRVQNENIIMAMEKVQSRYRTASNLAQGMTGDKEQSRNLTRDISKCMAAGMTGNDIAKIGVMINLRAKEQSHKKIIALSEQTLKTVMTMARIGVKSDSAVEIVQNALQTGYDTERMSRLEKVFIIQARTRFNPSDLAKSFAINIREGVPVDELGHLDLFNYDDATGISSSGNSGRLKVTNGQGNSGSSGGTALSGPSGNGSGGSGN